MIRNGRDQDCAIHRSDQILECLAVSDQCTSHISICRIGSWQGKPSDLNIEIGRDIIQSHELDPIARNRTGRNISTHGEFRGQLVQDQSFTCPITETPRTEGHCDGRAFEDFDITIDLGSESKLRIGTQLVRCDRDIVDGQ